MKAYVVQLKDGSFKGECGATVFCSEALHFGESQAALIASMKHVGSRVLHIRTYEKNQPVYQHEDLREHSNFLSHVAHVAIAFLLLHSLAGVPAKRHAVSTRKETAPSRIRITIINPAFLYILPIDRCEKDPSVTV